jgi:hypothetical protein
MELQEIQQQIDTLSNFLTLILNQIYKLESAVKVIRQKNN